MSLPKRVMNLLIRISTSMQSAYLEPTTISFQFGGGV